MRGEKVMLDLILDTARGDERIRAVVMNGSRADPDAPRDPFQDFDIVYFAADVEPYRHNLEWIGRFGELMILQLPDEMGDPPPARDADCCNEFWWVSAYVAKGLWRREILYAKHVLDHYVRDQLMKMLFWHAGQRTLFKASPWKYGKYLQRHMDADRWEALLRTYSDADNERTWDALMKACVRWRTTMDSPTTKTRIDA